MSEGRIIQSLSGYYDVQSNGEIFRCRGRGNFRKRKITPLVGDMAEFADGYILAVQPRTNELLRPPLANIDRGILVFSAKQPAFHPLLLDRFLVRMAFEQVQPLICVTKTDLADTDTCEQLQQYVKDYRSLGYPVVPVSAVTGEGIESVRELIRDHTSVFAGPSGVGKSSLLNALEPGLALTTNDLSARLGRGKHTTRRVALLSLASGFVADTPGFSSLDFRDLAMEDLPLYFPEMKMRIQDCKFRNCKHINEPGCAVKMGVAAGDIKSYRYNHYKQFIEEIQNQRRY